MYVLSEFCEQVRRDGEFRQTQFSNTAQPDSFCFVAAEKYLRQANQNDAISCVITSEELAADVDSSKALALVDQPERAFYEIHNRLLTDYDMRPTLSPGIDPSARIHETAHVDDYVRVGANVEIAPGAIVQSGCVLEDDVFVGPNAVVGADGHFYKKYDGQVFKVRHAGGVTLRRGVQVLAGAVVSKSLHPDFTVVGEESVVSIKAHVGHGCIIGERCIIAGNAQISGFTELKNDVWIGPSATIGNLLTIGNNVSVEVGSVVIENLPDNARVSGNFALDHGVNMMNFARIRRKATKK